MTFWQWLPVSMAGERVVPSGTASIHHTNKKRNPSKLNQNDINKLVKRGTSRIIYKHTSYRSTVWLAAQNRVLVAVPYAILHGGQRLSKYREAGLVGGPLVNCVPFWRMIVFGCCSFEYSNEWLLRGNISSQVLRFCMRIDHWGSVCTLLNSLQSVTHIIRKHASNGKAPVASALESCGECIVHSAHLFQSVRCKRLMQGVEQSGT